ncbi:MAG: arylsulfatase [Opitutaceae bacterium]|nr:arylsulfatase [Opitutaceae bacterium]
MGTKTAPMIPRQSSNGAWCGPVLRATRQFKLSLEAALLGALLVQWVPAASRSPVTRSRPNIILILADDLGYGDLSCYGNPKVSTPRIDSLARDGIRFTDAHTTSGLCTPSRYSLLTGRYCWRTFLKKNVVANGPALIEPGRTTVASVFKERGYQTAILGKWHLGFTAGKDVDYNAQPVTPGANEVGFTHSFLLPVGHFFPPYIYLENGRVVNYDASDPIAIVGSQQKGGKSYSYDPHQVTPELVRHSLAYIEENKARPFFLFLSTPSVHDPLTPSATFSGHPVGAYGDYIQEMDWAVGQILDKLNALNLENNSLVLFTSDNGASEPNSRAVKDHYRPSGPLRGDKGDLYEGGHRMPFLVRWPGQAPAGVVSDEFVIFSDLVRTFARLLEQPLRSDEGPDGHDVLDAFRGGRNLHPGRAMVIHSRQGMYGLRQDDWMYLHGAGDGDERKARYAPPSETIADAQLYNLREDLRQERNCAAQYPERVAQMRQRLAEIVAADETVAGAGMSGAKR